MMSPCLVRVTNPSSLSGPWIIKPVGFRGLPQNQSSSILKTDQFLVKTKTIYCKKWFSISFTNWFLPVLKTDRFLIFQSNGLDCLLRILHWDGFPPTERVQQLGLSYWPMV
jgi:hypothetical protein